MTPKKRIHSLDELRGFCVFCMVFDHALFTHGYMFGHETSRVLFDFFENISFAFAFTFILICGVSCKLSRNNFLRGSKILGAALCVSLASLIIMPDMPILFGILHLLGVCVLIYSFAGKYTDKLHPLAGIAICLILFLFTYNVAEGRYLGIGNFNIELPYSLFESNDLMFMGFISPEKAYSDYFPLLPWMFAFFAGTYLGRFAKEEKFPEFMYKSRIKPLSTLGQNAFFVYLIHQPLAYGVYYLISLIGG